jgi:hypothetical protein
MSQPTFASAFVWLMVLGGIGLVVLLWKLLWMGLRAVAL